MTVEVLRNLRRSLIINSKAGIHSVLMNSVWLSTKELSVVKYSKLAKVTTFVTFRISSLWGSLIFLEEVIMAEKLLRYLASFYSMLHCCVSLLKRYLSELVTFAIQFEEKFLVIYIS